MSNLKKSLSSKVLVEAINSPDSIVFVTPSSCKFLCAWSNPAFHQQLGWSCEDIMGLEIFFLHGDAADIIPLAKLLFQVETSLQPASRKVHCYSAAGHLLQCLAVLEPIHQFSQKDGSFFLSFISISFKVLEMVLFPVCLLDPQPRVFEVGLPMDRREYCKSYFDYFGKSGNRSGISDYSHFSKFCHVACLTNLVSLMLATPSLILLIDSVGTVVHGSAAWSTTFGHKLSVIVGSDLCGWLYKAKVCDESACSSICSALQTCTSDSIKSPVEDASCPQGDYNCQDLEDRPSELSLVHEFDSASMDSSLSCEIVLPSPAAELHVPLSKGVGASVSASFSQDRLLFGNSRSRATNSPIMMVEAGALLDTNQVLLLHRKIPKSELSGESISRSPVTVAYVKQSPTSSPLTKSYPSSGSGSDFRAPSKKRSIMGALISSDIDSASPSFPHPPLTVPSPLSSQLPSSHSTTPIITPTTPTSMLAAAVPVYPPPRTRSFSATLSESCCRAFRAISETIQVTRFATNSPGGSPRASSRSASDHSSPGGERETRDGSETPSTLNNVSGTRAPTFSSVGEVVKSPVVHALHRSESWCTPRPAIPTVTALELDTCALKSRSPSIVTQKGIKVSPTVSPEEVRIRQVCAASMLATGCDISMKTANGKHQVFSVAMRLLDSTVLDGGRMTCLLLMPSTESE